MIDRLISLLALLLGKPRPSKDAVNTLYGVVTTGGIELLADTVRHSDPSKRDELREALRLLSVRLQKEERLELAEEVLFLWAGMFGRQR